MPCATHRAGRKCFASTPIKSSPESSRIRCKSLIASAGLSPSAFSSASASRLRVWAESPRRAAVSGGCAVAGTAPRSASNKRSRPVAVVIRPSHLARRPSTYTIETGPRPNLKRQRTTPMSERTYSEAEIAEKLREPGLSGWYLEEGWLRRKYNTDGWPQTLMAVNAIGYLCEAAYHHADLSVTWGKVWVKLKTHSAGGITDKDFEVAKKIEDVVLWRPAGGPLGSGNPHKFVFSKS